MQCIANVLADMWQAKGATGQHTGFLIFAWFTLMGSRYLNLARRIKKALMISLDFASFFIGIVVGVMFAIICALFD